MTRTLLVIDDNISVRESLRYLLGRHGYEVLVADSGIAGLALAANHVVDGALIDVQMPGMNGIEVCQKLREQAAAAGRATAIWMMTGGRSPELAKRCVDVGALALLGKPFEVAELFRMLETQLGPVTPPPSNSPEPEFP